jgi:hypothetical protein
VPIVRKQLPNPITNRPKRAKEKVVATAVIKLPRATEVRARNPILRNPYLFTSNPAGSAKITPGITTTDIKSPAVAESTAKTDWILFIKGGIDCNAK